MHGISTQFVTGVTGKVAHTSHNWVQRPAQASNPKEEQLKAATGLTKLLALICRWRKDGTNSSNPHDDPVGGGVIAFLDTLFGAAFRRDGHHCFSDGILKEARSLAEAL
jgi:hypothetical protein